VLTIFICAHQRPSTAIGKKPLPADVLLRESLYLLQGISGVHISFATAPAAQPNPYLLPPHHFPSAGPATGASPHLSSASFEGDGPIDEIEEAGQLIFRESTEGGSRPLCARCRMQRAQAAAPAIWRSETTTCGGAASSNRCAT
jgi:hypothetical protein